MKHSFGPHSKTSKGSGHPIMFGFKESEHFDVFPEGGGYPKNFLKHAFETLGVTDPQKVLHLCSGSMKSGITVDIRPEKNPTYVADCRNTPFLDASFDWIMVDPPYAESYAENLYGTGDVYPKPGQILKEVSRLLRPGGRAGLLHFIVPMIRRPLKMVGVWGITTGAGYAIRAWTVLEKEQ
jgi:SAM-dependent methyltransferase